jgi:cyclopropane-fatty-acyl-phospholipid synthase
MTGINDRSIATRTNSNQTFLRRAGADLRERLVAKLFSGIRYGRMRLIFPDGGDVEFCGAEPGPEASVALHRWRAVFRAARGGALGMAEAYLDGDWTSPDLTAFIRLAARNLDAFDDSIRGTTVLAFLNRLRHRLRKNSKRGSRRNIEFHYDLGNDFFRVWLDRAMIYSSALWQQSEVDLEPDLETAQQRKLDRIADLLRLSGGESVLEIGCGWGALAAHLAERGARVTGLTLSPSQLTFAREMISERGLQDRVDLRLQDYRDAAGGFDRVVSIEMIEAVGEAYWPDYFGVIRDRLKPGGVAVLQCITIAEERYESYRVETDFIQKHIFPGGFLPSKSMLAEEVRRAGLRLADSQCFGPSYARTLSEWRRRFHGRWPCLEAQGYDRKFRRLWDYYLCYCEAGFLEQVIDVGIYTIERPIL